MHRLIGSGISRAAPMGAVFAGGALLLPVLLITGAPLIASTGNVLVAAYMANIPKFLGHLQPRSHGQSRTRSASELVWPASPPSP